MAYKVLIIDDEPLAREGLRSMCDWTREGFEIVAEAASAAEAQRYLQANHVDLVLTDIVMDGESGLALLRYLADRAPMTQRIVISCHDRFEYATESLRAGALDYLFKLSLNEQSLTRALRKASQVLASLNPGGSTPDPFQTVERASLASALGYESEDASPVGIVVIGPGVWAWRHVDSVNTLAELLDEQRVRYVRPDGGEFGIIVSHECTPRQTANIATTIWRAFGGVSGGAPTVQLHHDTYSPGECALVIESMLENAGLRHIFGSGALVPAAVTSVSLEGGLSLAEGQNVRRLVRSWRLFGACAFAIATLERRARSGQAFSMQRSVATELLWIFRQQLPNDSPGQTSRAEEAVVRATTVFELAVACTRPLVKHLIDTGLDRNERGNAAIDRVCEYIAENITKRVTLEEAAEVAGMSPSYLSTRFRELMNESFIKYSNRIRIEAAARMLAAGQEIQHVAGSLGYHDQSYFYRLFKRVTGVTPGTIAGSSHSGLD